MKKVIVVGGGVAGLSAGIYARRCGFDVTVIESHSIAGGACTAWKRNGYLFEGAMHWLTGSSKKEPVYKLWRCVGALDDDVKIHYNDLYFEYAYKDTPIRIYRDLDKTEQHWIDISPADKAHIKTLFNYVRKVDKLIMPIFKLKGVKYTKRFDQPLLLPILALIAVRRMKSLSKLSSEEFVGKFSHEGLRDMLKMHAGSGGHVRYLVLTLASLARGSGGFPEGGSLPFIMRMVKKLKSMGGDIIFNTKVEQVLVENGKAVGVIAGGERLDADAVIVTADTMAAQHLFDFPLNAPWLERMRSGTLAVSAVFVSLGINADLRGYPKSFGFKLEEPLKVFSRSHEFLKANNYANDPKYSPEGKTAITFIIGGDDYDKWKKTRDEGQYEKEKQRIGDDVVKALIAQIPEAEGKVEVIDVATPLTYERYCSSWRGSWMSAMMDGMRPFEYPSVIDGLSGVYFASHRMLSPGGLPVALRSGRTAVLYLCRDTKTVFVTEE